MLTRRRLAVSAFALAAGLLAGCIQPPPEELAVWSESVPYERVESELESLATHDAALYIAVTPARVGASLWSLLRAAQTAGVPVRVWLQLPDQGVWLHEGNVDAFAAFADDVLAAGDLAQTPIEWLVFDLEPALDLAERLSRAADGEPLALLAQFAEQRDAAAFAAATRRLREIVVGLQARGVRVMAAALPWAVDDALDGDAGLQDLLNTPVVGVPWDQVSVLVYRPWMRDLFGAPFGPGLVARYARDARRVFGADVQIALGHIGAAGLLVGDGYDQTAGLRADIASARQAGVRRISLFSLDGMLDEGGVARWLAAARLPAPAPPAFAPLVDLLRGLLRQIDALPQQTGAA